jgi:hypothetical protein
MKKARQTKKRKGSRRYYVLTFLFLFLASSTASYLYFKPILAFKSPFIDSIESRQKSVQTGDIDENSRRLYAARGQKATGPDMFERGNLLATAEDVIRRYISQRKIKLLDLYMDKEGIIYADFGSELRNNFQGDASEEYTIVSALYKRLRINIPNFTALKILIEGQEVESFGGHIIITKPIGEKIEGVTRRKTERYF